MYEGSAPHERKVAYEGNFLCREIYDEISAGMSRPEVVELDGISAGLNHNGTIPGRRAGRANLVRKVVSQVRGSRSLRGLLQILFRLRVAIDLQPLRKSVEPIDMIAIAVREDEAGNGLVRQFPDFIEDLSRSIGGHFGIDNQK